MNTSQRFLLVLACCAILLAPMTAAAQNATKTPPAQPAKAAPVKPKPGKPLAGKAVQAQTDDNATAPRPGESKNPNNQTYREWLERYSAWDKLDQVYASQSDETPETVLKRARIAMQGAQPMQAIKVIEETTPFENKALEVQRLWLGGQAYRALGDAPRAVLWFSQAGKLLNPQEMRAQFASEPGLEVLWTDVWRKLFWVYAFNDTVSREGQAIFLGTTLNQAETVWGKSALWQAAHFAYERSAPGDDTNASTAKPYFVSQADRRLVAQYLAGLSLDRPDASQPLESIASNPVRQFWQACDQYIQARTVPTEAIQDLDHADFFRAADFLRDFNKLNLLLDFASDRRLEGTESFKMFMRNIMAVPPAEAYGYFLQGREAMFMDAGDAPVRTESLRFALAILAGDDRGAVELWRSLDRSILPPSLVLAGTILSGEDALAVTRSGAMENADMRAIVTALAEAGGSAPALPHQSPFWTQATPERLAELATRQWPLDDQLLLAHWTRQWSRQPSAELARRVAFLFPESDLGVACTLFLAETALTDHQYPLAGYYLDLVAPEQSNATLESQRIEVRAEWQVANEDMDGALASYEQLLSRTTEISDTTRLKMAFLMQRKGRLEEGRDQLLRLWDNHESFPTSMQAEILYYLGEGEQAMNNSDQALDYFLKLAWQYPQESMWALTAMYRAASIYTSRGQYEPARNLLRTVAKNANTDKQRETAQARLDEVEAQMAKPSDHGAGTVPYPF